MALDEGMGMVAPRRPRRRMAGPPDPISEALAAGGGGDRPDYRPMDETGEPWGMDENPEDADVLRNLLQTRGEGLEEGRYPPDEEEEGEGPGGQDAMMRLLQMLQGGQGEGEGEEMRPLDEEGDPWGMDTDPGDADVLRNLLATRRQGLQQGRYPPDESEDAERPQLRQMHPFKTEGLGPAYSEDGYPMTLSPSEQDERSWPDWVEQLQPEGTELLLRMLSRVGRGRGQGMMA